MRALDRKLERFHGSLVTYDQRHFLQVGQLVVRLYCDTHRAEFKDCCPLCFLRMLPCLYDSFISCSIRFVDWLSDFLAKEH